MKNILWLFIAVLSTLIFSTANAQTELLINTMNRSQISLNGEWQYIVDPYEYGFYNYRLDPYDQQENPAKDAFFMNAKVDNKSELLEYNFDKTDQISVPGDWNTQKENLFFYEGTVWYKKSFDYQKQSNTNRVFLYFGAVNYRADVYFNGIKLGVHIGGFTPFNFEVTDLVKDNDNFVVVKVDNKRLLEGVPTTNTDWWNYGGITRDVKIIETPGTFVSDYMIQLDAEEKGLISGYIQLNGENAANAKIELSIPEMKIDENLITNQDGKAIVQFKAKKLKHWSPEDPKLYEVVISSGVDVLKDQIGFRTIKTEGVQILLNEEPVFLKGICIHEERIGGGRIRTSEENKELLTVAKELGCNYVRLAHYPHNENMVRLADEMGLLVWEEIPVYWTIDWENEETYQNAENQLTEAIIRDKNRASVIIWSMANETPTIDARFEFLKRLSDHTRSLDPTRLISAALEKSSYKGNPNIQTIDDPFAEVVDVLSFNQYVGWYDGLPEKCGTISWKIEQNKPVLISEFGAGTKYGYHADSLTRWSEEYQVYLYRETLKMLEKIEQFQGVTPWILMDFRSPRRPLPEIQDYWNRKGLISETGEKKQAFFTLQEYYKGK